MSKIYQKLFAKYYDRGIANLEKDLFSKRKQLLSDLEGDILGVGEGTGVNFQFYNNSANVTALEPSLPMLEIAKVKAERLKMNNIHFVNKGIHDVAFKQNTYDVIVCTLVLCTMPEPQKALENFKKWLKPDGKLIVLEHIHSSKPTNRIFQNVINPVWKLVSEGCNLNRDTDQFIKSAGFSPVNDSYFYRSLKFYMGVFRKKL